MADKFLKLVNGVLTLADADHGGLAGLSDDDHTQYQLRSEKDAASGYAGLDSNGKVNYGRIQNISATDKILGRATAGAGVIEEIACTAAARSILDDASVAAILTTLGGMAYSDARFNIGIFTRDTGQTAGTQAITGVGFTPKALIFLAAEPSTKEVSIGFSTSSGNLALVSLTDTGNWSVDGAAIEGYQTGANILKGTVTSFDSDGFTVTWAKTGYPSGTLNVIWLALR